MRNSNTDRICTNGTNPVHTKLITLVYDRIGGVVVSMFTSSVVERGFQSRSGQTLRL